MVPERLLLGGAAAVVVLSVVAAVAVPGALSPSQRPAATSQLSTLEHRPQANWILRTEAVAAKSRQRSEMGWPPSKGVTPMGEEPPAGITDLAEEYLNSLGDDDGSEEDADEVREGLEYWERQVGGFEEGTVIHELAVDERDEWCEKLEAIDAGGSAARSSGPSC